MGKVAKIPAYREMPVQNPDPYPVRPEEPKRRWLESIPADELAGYMKLMDDHHAALITYNVRVDTWNKKQRRLMEAYLFAMWCHHGFEFRPEIAYLLWNKAFAEGKNQGIGQIELLFSQYVELFNKLEILIVKEPKDDHGRNSPTKVGGRKPSHNRRGGCVAKEDKTGVRPLYVVGRDDFSKDEPAREIAREAESDKVLTH